MIRFNRVALFAALAVLAAAPAEALVGYGVESGTPMYEALQHGYRPPLEGQYRHYHAPPRRWRPAPRRSR